MTQAGNNVENVENNWEKFVNLESLLNMRINGDFMKTVNGMEKQYVHRFIK